MSRAEPLFWLVHELDGARVVRIQEGGALIFARLHAAIDGFGSTYVEAQPARREAREAIPKRMMGCTPHNRRRRARCSTGSRELSAPTREVSERVGAAHRPNPWGSGRRAIDPSLQGNDETANEGGSRAVRQYKTNTKTVSNEDAPHTVRTSRSDMARPSHSLPGKLTRPFHRIELGARIVPKPTADAVIENQIDGYRPTLRGRSNMTRPPTRAVYFLSSGSVLDCCCCTGCCCIGTCVTGGGGVSGTASNEFARFS